MGGAWAVGIVGTRLNRRLFVAVDPARVRCTRRHGASFSILVLFRSLVCSSDLSLQNKRHLRVPLFCLSSAKQDLGAAKLVR